MKSTTSKKAGRSKSWTSPPASTMPKPRRARSSAAFRNILATTDLSKESIEGVRYAASLAKKLNAAVALLHLVEFPSPPPMPGMRTLMQSAHDQEIGKRARAQLQTLARREGKGELNMIPILRTGNSANAIITAARKRRSDLIVLATHGYTGAKRVLLGSTTERVVRHAPCSVLTVPTGKSLRRTGKARTIELKKILVAIDFSTTSESALPWAASIAARFDAELALLYVVEKFPIDYVIGPDSMNSIIAPLIKQGNIALKELAERLKQSTGLTVTSEVRLGKPFEEISSASQRLGANLIVLTTHGNTGLKRLWLGSTAERVVRHANRPVLVVRALQPQT